MTERKTRKGKDATDKSEIEIMDLESAEHMEKLYQKYPGTRPTSKESDKLDRLLAENPITVTFPNFPVKEKPHCPAELVKALKKEGIRVRLPGPLEERLQNDLMMEWWQGKHTKDKK